MGLNGSYSGPDLGSVRFVGLPANTSLGNSAVFLDFREPDSQFFPYRRKSQRGEIAS